MDVQLYVYDLSRGMARQYSQALTGIQIDAIYHTAIVFGGVEYFFGQGVHRKVPGTTHHGRPMKIVDLGQTHLPIEVIDEFVQSLEAIYTPESYDLFLHNCNNFSQDLSMFLVGESIPDEIRTLPETFLKTPIGQMLRGQIDQSMRQMTQAPDAVSGQNIPRAQPASLSNGAPSKPVTNHATSHTKVSPAAFINGKQSDFRPGRVQHISNTSDLDRLLKSAESTCAVIFFTSATCPPCKIVYPAYDELAEEAGDKAVLIKVDTSVAYSVASRYQIRATPTFITFLKGKKDQEWSGAHEARLRGNVRLLIQMANPQHTHLRLKLPSLEGKISKPTMYTKMPPLDKLLAKIGPASNDQPIRDLTSYIRTREGKGFENAPTPNLHALSDWIATSFTQLSTDVHFAVIDLVRIAAADTRVSSYLVAEQDHKILSILIPSNKDYTTAPYNLQVVTLQLACNLFSSPVFQESIIDVSNPLRAMIEHLVSRCLLAKHHNARSLAAALVFNLAAFDHNERLDGKHDRLDVSTMGDLEAALVEAVVNEAENKETLHSLLMALGLLLYCAPTESAVWDLCAAMDVRVVLKEKAKDKVFAGEALLKEIGEELLAKGGSA